MTPEQIEANIRKNYVVRNARLSAAVGDGASRIGGARRNKGRSAICRQPEWGRGLVVYRKRDGEEIFVGERCAEYLDYLVSNPRRAEILLRR